MAITSKAQCFDQGVSEASEALEASEAWGQDPEWPADA